MRHLAATLALAFAAAPVLAQDRAVPRGSGGSGGGSSSGGGASHHSGGGSSSSGSSDSSYSGGGSSGGRSHSSSRAVSPAERRHPRPGTGTGHRYPYYGGYYRGYDPWYPWYYPSSYAYGPYWGSYYYGYWPYGAYYGGYAAAPYYRSYRRSDYESGAVRVLVDPEDAKVYVDGYYAGRVDDFDGLTQRLYLSRGLHEILVKREGYRTARFRVYASPGHTLKVEHDMEKGDGEEPLQDLTGGRGDDFDRPAPRPDPDEDEEELDDDAPRPRVRVEDEALPGARSGSLRLRVTPADASVYVDGEFRGTAREVRSLELRPGTHRIEVVRPGFATAQREVVVEGGQTRDLEVTLREP
jgi:hypothetical protein